MSEVKVYADKLPIKTYLLEEPDPNPFFVEYLGMPNFYPYPLKNRVAKEARDVLYNVYCLENEYFKLTVLPDLGGKLYACYDKRCGRDIFYRNPVIKPQMVGTTGAWTSGGVEFNYPNRGHRPSAVDYTDTVMQQYGDGSAAIIISEVDRISWLRFSVELRLYPGRAYIEQIVRLYNPNAYHDSYYVWSTSSELETPGLVWRYPTLWYIEETDLTRHLWPLGPGGQDYRYNDTIKQFALPFTSEVLKDYMGLFDPATNSGIVHLADYRQVPGKKIWSWGSASAGRLWCKRLTDNDDCYVELQAGAVETQNQFNFLEPHNTLLFREYWLYSLDNGPLGAASRDLICSYQLKEGRLQFSVTATGQFPGTTMMLRSGGEEVFRQELDLDPLTSRQVSIELDLQWLDGDLEVVFVHGKQVLLRETVLDHDEALVMIDREEYIPADRPPAPTEQALRAEKSRFYNQAIELAEKLRASNPDCVEAALQVGRCYLKKGLAEKAVETLAELALSNPQHAELQYYFGLALWRTSQQERALKAFLRVPNSSKLFAAASYFMALAHIHSGAYEKAVPKLEYNQEVQKFHYKSRLLLAYALLKLEDKERAAEVLEAYLQEHPVDYVALYLQDQLKETPGARDLIFGQPQNVYEMLEFLDEAGDWPACAELLRAYAVQEGADPLLKCYVHYYTALLSGTSRKDGLKQAVEAISLDYVFPNHGLDRKILQTILDVSPKAQYLYGLLAFKAQNYQEAKGLWEGLVEQDYPYSAVYRNLAFYYQKHEQDYTKASAIAKRGLSKEPPNADLYAILATCYRKLGDRAACRTLVQVLQERAELKEQEAGVLIDLLNYLGEHDKAAPILERTEFLIWENAPEGLLSYHRLYKDTYKGMARQALAAKDYDRAEWALEKCLHMEKRYEEKFAELYFYMGLLQEKRGNFSRAVEYYRRAVAEDITAADKENYQYLVKAAHRLVKLDWLGIR